jgi:hypothetical protein
VLSHMLNARLCVLEAFESARQEAFKYNNPFPLIYSLYLDHGLSV